MAANAAPMAAAEPTVRRKSCFRWRILLLISVMYMITYLDRANISVTAPAMAAELALSKTKTGLILSRPTRWGKTLAASSPIGVDPNGCYC